MDKQVIRVALIGTGGVGKSEMIQRLCYGNPFSPTYFPTEGKESHLLDLDEVKFVITEYSGQEQLRYVPQEELASITAYILVSQPSRAHRQALKELKKRLPANIPNCTVMNKSDIYARPDPQHMWCSAKTGTNLLEPFRYIANQSVNKLSF
jgi:GTPase SAR1 family protein